MGHPGPQIRGPKRTLRLIGDAFLWTAAIAGLICIALVIAAQIFNVSLIMFKTGSMSPTIPAGSVALMQEISASEVKSGDIITVDRPGDLPVTHRVISVEPIDNGQWRVEMKGDANVQPDPLPYDVVEVRQTMGHLPDLATVIVSLGSPWVLGGMTLGAAGLVTWAFWPRSQRTGTKG
ncbi:signal peptidase I [Arthrobacter sp. AQ5-05]|uniref:signal peptidase I n=1 Tax=Arthrobacter sp. AQ5-05 TaxID=2184581 RepID=UPI000DCD72DE|nr:signal peptidase I [Arthrobacter sp. AQ5-05]RAX49555.1 signal peptidase I [Arthrobacter sp. AQ5-05]